MERELKEKRTAAVLFLLAALLLLGVLILQIRSAALEKDISVQREIQTVEARRTDKAPAAVSTTNKLSEAEHAYALEQVELYAQTAAPHRPPEKPAQPKSVQPKPARKTAEDKTKQKQPAAAAKPPKTTKVQEILTAAEKTEPQTEITTVPQLAPVLSVNFETQKIHGPSCSALARTNPESIKQIRRAELEEYLSEGYALCSKCKGYA